MKWFKRFWPVLFSLLMLFFAGFCAWHVYASGSLESKTKKAVSDLEIEQDLLRTQQKQEKEDLEDIQYYQDIIADIQPEYDIVISKKTLQKKLGQEKKLLSGVSVEDDGEIEYEIVEDEEEEDFWDEDF